MVRELDHAGNKDVMDKSMYCFVHVCKRIKLRCLLWQIRFVADGSKKKLFPVARVADNTRDVADDTRDGK